MSEYPTLVGMTIASGTSPLFDLPGDAGKSATPEVFDLQGAPLNMATALSMQRPAVVAVVTRVIADIDGLRPDEFNANSAVAADGSPVIDSLQGAFAVAAFNAAFGKKKLIKLSDVPETSWASVDAVADLIWRSLSARKDAEK